MGQKKRFLPGIEGLEVRVVPSHPSTQQLAADVRRVAESLESALPLTSSTLLHALAKKPADLSIQPGGQLGSLYNEIEGSSSLQQFAASVFGSAPGGSSSGSSQQLALNSGADLNDSINNMASAAFQVQKNPDGSGTITLSLRGTYNPAFATFEDVASGVGRSARLAKDMRSIGRNWSHIIHPYTFQLSATYSYPASGGGGSQSSPSNFPLGTYRGTYSGAVYARNLASGTGDETPLNSNVTITVSIDSYDSLDGLASATITLANLAGQTISAPFQGNIAEGRDINVLAFNLGYEGNSSNLGISIGGEFQGTTMVVTTFNFDIIQGFTEYFNPDQNVSFDLTPV
jgi:hypothetical protein